MGVAAYNRGSKAISEQLKREYDARARPVEFEVMDRFNAIEKDPDATTPFGPANIVAGNGGYWIECPTTGFGYWYENMRAIMRRWPANFILDDEAAAMLDAQTGQLTSGVMAAGTRRAAQDGPGSVCYGTYGGNATASDTYGDTGGASRFFYCAKPSRAERDAGTHAIDPRQRDESRKAGDPGGDNPRNRGVRKRGNFHPTVKPVELMRWLIRLVTPLGGLVLDPFVGSGTTGVAAWREGRRFIGIEREPEYFEIARRRLDDATRQGRLL